MGLERRGSGLYYYSKKRIGKKVVSEYVSAGQFARLAHQLDQDLRAEAEEERRLEVASRKDFLFPGFHEYCRTVSRWVDRQMFDAGYFRHKRGEWRKMSKSELAMQEIGKAGSNCTELMTRVAMLGAYQKDMDPETSKRILRELDERVQHLLFDGDSALERVLAERIAMAEVQVQVLQNAAFCTTNTSARVHLDRELNGASNRLLQAVKSLASIRRVPNLTLVQVNQANDRGHNQL